MALDAPRMLEFTVHGPIARSDLDGLCARVCALVAESTADVGLCDVLNVEPNAATVDALARLQLMVRRHRCRVILRNASAELVDLVVFMGLDEVLPSTARAAAAGRTAGTRGRCRGRT
jgi:hypothetical protein